MKDDYRHTIRGATGVFIKGGGQYNLVFDFKCICNKVLFV